MKIRGEKKVYDTSKLNTIFNQVVNAKNILFVGENEKELSLSINSMLRFLTDPDCHRNNIFLNTQPGNKYFRVNKNEVIEIDGDECVRVEEMKGAKYKDILPKNPQSIIFYPFTEKNHIEAYNSLETAITGIHSIAGVVSKDDLEGVVKLSMFMEDSYKKEYGRSTTHQEMYQDILSYFDYVVSIDANGSEIYIKKIYKCEPIGLKKQYDINE